MGLNFVYAKSLNRLRSTNSKAFILIFLITFSIFVFTSDAHRYTFDEALAQDQAIRIATLEPHPDYVQGESRIFFEYTWLYPPAANKRAICENAILCSQASVIHSGSEAPFLAINENFHIITNETIDFTPIEFNNPAYALWRNSLEPNFTFMELLYGPFFCALSTAVLFLVSRTYLYSIKTSLILSFLFAFTTIVWAYSQTSLNSVLATFLILLAFLFFRRFQIHFSSKSILISSIILGLAFLTRLDAILIIIPLFFYFLYVNVFPGRYFDFLRNGKKITNFLCFTIPLFSAYGISKLIEIIRLGSAESVATSMINAARLNTSEQSVIPLFDLSNSYAVNAFGMLFSPGVGILIFAPILLTAFLSFPDFFKRHKSQCLLFLIIIGFYIWWISQSSAWHGLTAWGERYLVMLIPFFLLPLGASIEKRTHISFKISLVVLGGLGVLFNFAWLLQDVPYFIWGVMGAWQGGLYDIGESANLWIDPLVLWTFEYSQLTHSFIWLFYRFQHDIFLLHAWGAGLYSIIISVVIAPQIFLLFRFIKNYSKTSKLVNEKRTIR